jgi:hypothetical protein
LRTSKNTRNNWKVWAHGKTKRKREHRRVNWVSYCMSSDRGMMAWRQCMKKHMYVRRNIDWHMNAHTNVKTRRRYWHMNAYTNLTLRELPARECKPAPHFLLPHLNN